MSNDWPNTHENFIHTWNLVSAPSLVVTQSDDNSFLDVTANSVPGLLNNALYQGSFIESLGRIYLPFLLTAVNLENGQKKLAYQSALKGASTIDATSPAASGTPGTWGNDPDNFLGVWTLDGGGKITIGNHTHVQMDSVPGIKNGLYQGIFEADPGEIGVLFTISNNGYDSSDQKKEVSFQFPAAQIAPFDVPTEDENFEEADAGSGY